MVEVLLGTLGELMISTREGYLVILSLELPLRSPLESPNNGAFLGSLFGYITGIILVMFLVNPLGCLIEYIWRINLCGPWLGT